MAFTWTSKAWTSGVDAVTKGSSKILATHITELRENADWVADKVCNTHDSTNNKANKATHYKAENNTHQASYESTDKSTPHFSTDKSVPHFSSNKTPNNSTVKAAIYGLN